MTIRQLPRCRVILETAAQSFRIADQARAAGHEVRVVPATLVRTLGVGARRTKTDKRDARALSDVQAAGRLCGGAHANVLVVRDFNIDGKLDIAVANAGEGSVSV